jgi:DNA polymerase-1
MVSPLPAVHLPDPKKTLYLLDISSFIFRAFFAIRGLKTKTGEPTNAVYGVATMLARLAEEAQPEYLAVTYDSKEPSFRKEIYPEYKANRTEAPDDLVPQFARIEQLITAFEIHSYRESGIEADDLIATLTHRWLKESAAHQVVIVTSDKDLMQLVSDRVTVWDTMSNKTYSPKEVEEKFSVKPEQIRDYLGIVGDSSDNIPGVPGIGPKGASELLKEFKDLPGILEAAKEGRIPGKKGEALVTHREKAILSAELATVRQDLKLEIPIEALQYHFHVTDQCVQLMHELDFHTLVTRWKGALATQSAAKPVLDSTPETSKVEPSETEATLADLALAPDDRFRTLNTQSELLTLIEELKRTVEFGFDLETNSLNPREAEIIGIAICYDPAFAFYIPLGHKDESTPQLPRAQVYEALRPFIEDSKYKKIGQNLKYDWSVLREQGFHPKGIGADTMVAAYLLNPEGRHNLTKLSAQYLDYTVLTFEQLCGKGKSQLTFDQIGIAHATRYAAEDAWLAMQLWKKLQPLLKEEGLMQIFTEVDLPMVEVLTDMELEGVSIDVDWLKSLSDEFGLELQQIENRIQTYTQGPVNLNSPKQISKLLFEDLKLPPQSKTKTGLSTDASVLEILAPLHPVPDLLLEYREISKLKGTYVDPLPLLKDSKTGKIHAGFHQTVAATGRLSSSDPNLQNIPIRSDRGLRIRRAFVASPGNLLISADYSQIELRLLAHMSGDTELTHSFQNDEDVHRRTASDIFEIPANDVDDRQRSIAKAINFGLMYGKTPFGLSQELKISRKEAQEMIQRYFQRYHAVKTFLDAQIQGAKEKGYVLTLLGRKRKLADILSKNAAIRNNAERMAMNSPIQGTAADLMKLAMIQLQERLKKGAYRSKLIIQVHDEVLLDCPKEEAEEMKALVINVMENAMKLSVPLRVNAAIGKNWMEL